MDWNSDGTLDLIFGQRRGSINLYTGNGDGTLHFVGHVYDDAGREIKTIYNSSPWLVDWNGDGELDLLLTGYLVDTIEGGILRVYPGTGVSNGTLVFDADYYDLTWLYDRRRSTAQTCDLDGDGDMDLVIGYETGEVYFAENTGSIDMPIFSSCDVLHCDDGLINVYSRYAGSGRARPHVCDYDSDGVPDLLVGCENGWIYAFLGYTDDTGSGSPSAPNVPLTVLEPLTSGELRFDLSIPAGATADVTVRDSSGEVIASMTGLEGGPGTCDIPGSHPGVYTVTAQCGDMRNSRLVMVPW